MYKVVWVARYSKGLTRQEACDRWVRSHAAKMLEVSPVAGYVQSLVQGPLPAVSGVAEEETLFDGYSSGWWNDRADFEQAMGTSAWQRVLEDGAGLFDAEFLANMSARVEEVPMIEGPTTPYKVVWIVRFKQGLSREQAREHWRDVHGPIFKKLEIDRYIQNHVVGRFGDEEAISDGDVGFDGFSECWFRDEAQFRAAVQSDTWALAVEDARTLFDVSQMWGAALKENVVVPPPFAA